MKGLGLLVVDMQENILSAVPNRDDIVKRACFAVEGAQLLGIPCFYTEQMPDKLGDTAMELLETGLKSGLRWEKSKFSAFGADGLEAELKSEGINHLLIGGVESTICVYQTIVEALKKGFGVTVLRDCMGARRPEDEKAIVAALQKMDCQVLPVETVYYSIVGDANYGNFRTFTHIVKKYME